jgi:deoxyribodipyrimidine photolyase
MTTLRYWFHNDLRLHDNLTFVLACERTRQLILVRSLWSTTT